MSTSRHLRHLLALALLVPLAAWADEPDPEAPGAAPPAETARDTAPAGETMHHSITLEARNGSGVTGEAMAMHSDDAVVIMLELDGLPGEGEYPAHIHTGSCEEGGPVAVPLDPVIGLADGTGSSTTTLEIDEVGTETPHFIQVHGEGGTPVACGNMEGHGH